MNILITLFTLILPLQLLAIDDVIEVTNKQTSLETIIPPQQTQSAKTQSKVEKINITGSRIKRIDTEGPSPVLTLDREYLNQSGYNSVADVLRDTTVSSFGAEREYSDESNSVGAATVGLRGLGSDRTLVLMDGRRLPKIDGGNSVDLNLIPFEAIERIEILKDGASAIYGSDALAGVINFITKKDFDGANFKARYAAPELKGGSRQEISATYGKNFSKGNFLAIYQYRNNERIMDSDRPWSRGASSGNGSPGSYKLNNNKAQWQAMDNCPKERIRYNSDGSSECTFDYSVYTSGLPDTEQHSALLRGEYDLAGNLNSFAMATYTHRQVRWQWAPSADDFKDASNVGGSNYTVPQKVSKLNNEKGLPADFELRYRTVNELGPRLSRDTTDAYGVLTGVRGEIFETWEWETSLNYGSSQLLNSRHGGYGNKEILFNSMLNGKMRPFANEDQKTYLAEAHHVGEQIIRSNVTSVNFITSGGIGEFFGTPLNMASGLSSTWEGYQIDVDDVTASGDLFGGIGEAGKGERNYQSLFSELGLNFGSVEVQVAGRLDNYSDFGSTLNPKLSLRYTPIKSLMFRGSAGTGFRAPSLAELYSTSSDRYPWFTDTQSCQTVGGSFCEVQQYRVFSGGNRNLKEETSFSINAGTVIQPTRNFSISMDYWETTVKNAVGLNYDDLMLAEQTLGPAALLAKGVAVNRDGNGRIIDIVAPNLNLAQQQSKGLEFVIRHSMRLGALIIRPQIDHSHLLENKEEIFPGLGLRNKLGENGRPEWRNNISLSFGLFNHGLRLSGRTIAGQYKSAHISNPNNTSRIATYTEYDLHYDYSEFFGGQISMGVKNLFGFNRPLDDTAGFADQLNSQLYDQVGRLVYLGYAHTF